MALRIAASLGLIVVRERRVPYFSRTSSAMMRRVASSPTVNLQANDGGRGAEAARVRRRIADEVREKGTCVLTIPEIASRAGVGVTKARMALRDITVVGVRGLGFVRAIHAVHSLETIRTTFERFGQATESRPYR
jgi:hypothetical protein